MKFPTLDEYCRVVASSVTAAVLGVEELPPTAETEKLIADLKQEFMDAYVSDGMPEGETEEDLVRYLLKTVTYEIGDNT